MNVEYIAAVDENKKVTDPAIIAGTSKVIVRSKFQDYQTNYE